MHPLMNEDCMHHLSFTMKWQKNIHRRWRDIKVLWERDSMTTMSEILAVILPSQMGKQGS